MLDSACKSPAGTFSEGIAALLRPSPCYTDRTPPTRKPDENSVLERVYASGFPPKAVF
jgi:hypothetical protein